MTVTDEGPDSVLVKLLDKLDSASKTNGSGNPDDEPLEKDPEVDEVPGSVRFEGSEHRAIGDAVKLYDINGKELDASTYIVQTIARHGTDLTFGRIISLAGDFYSNRGPTDWFGWTAEYAPICGAYYNPPPKTPEGRFSDMVSAMLLDDFDYMSDIKGALDLEKKEIDDNLSGTDGGGTARTFHEAKNIHGDAWFSEKTVLAYPKIAWQNADHFGNDALFCYKVGHTMACNAAVQAGLAKAADERTKLLNSAYFIEACSLHYLTDMFSSGHMRAPRRAFHYTDYSVMKKVGIAGIPVWDSQCRIMHDDDNSTGLLCKNGNGDQWIAFGDKQLFMPGNCVNRARVIHAVQTSIGEVFSYFQRPLDDTQQVKKVGSDTKFQTLPLIPRVSVSVSNDPDWASTLTDNPAPIWVAKLQNDPSRDQGWYYRGQTDNHAAYQMADGHPGFADETSGWEVASSVKEIMKSDFLKGDEQFPITEHVECGVGMLQLSETSNSWQKPTDYTQRVCANIWNPVLIQGKQYGGSPQTMTLRSRLSWRDLSLDDPRTSPLVHALGYFNGKTTTALVLRMHVSNGDNNPRSIAMNASCLDINNAKEGQPDQWYFTPGQQQAQITTTTRWNNKQIFSQAYDDSVNMMDFRCFVVNPKTADSQMTLLSVVCDSTSVYYSRTYLKDASTLNNKQAVTDWTQMSSPNDPAWAASPLVKAWECGNGKRAILFCQHSAIVNGSFDWRVAALQVTDTNGHENYIWTQKLVDQKGISVRYPATDAYHNIKSSCFLVGDILGSTNWLTTAGGIPCEQIAAVTISPTYTQLDIVGWCDTESPKVVCKHDCPDDLQKGPTGPYKGEGYLRDYLIGLVDSQLDDTKSGTKGLDIVHVSLHHVGNTCHLKFKTHVNDRAKRSGAPVPGKDQDYFGSCNVNWIKDELMTKERYESGRYQSLKWLRMDSSMKQQKNAIMEVFSWYGILGLRYFAASWDGKKYDYSLVGVQPFNGQTSGTIGRGIYGTWGEGFMTMGQESRAGGISLNGYGFRDVNYYNMVLGGKIGHGYWDSANKDPTVWTDPGFKGGAIRRESAFVRGVGDDVTPLAF